MAKTSAQTLITNLAKRVDQNSSDAVLRADILRQLNISQHAILQDFSFRFLVTEGTLSLGNGASTIAVPSTIDDGKTIAIGKHDGSGRIEYVEPDAWYEPYESGTAPSRYTIALVGGVLTFSFKPGNTTGGSINIPYRAQLIPVAMTDASNSFAALPEGWEDTLLLDHAEIEYRRSNPDTIQSAPQYLLERVTTKQESLYSSYRTTKEQPFTDREQKERAAVREMMSQGARRKKNLAGQDL